MKKLVSNAVLCVQPLPQTIVSCRDKDGNIVLSSLTQKLQKQPNMETRSDSDGNSQETYVEEYSIVQYEFKENPEDT